MGPTERERPFPIGTGTTLPQMSKRDRKIDAIHTAAARRFAERGYRGTRMADIAADLDMQAGSLYYYFASKEELLVAIIESRVGKAVESLRSVLAGAGSYVEKVRTAIVAHLRAFQDDADIYSIFNFERLSDISPGLAEQVHRPGREYEALWGQLLDAGISSGELRPDLDTRVTVKAIVGLCNSVLLWYRPDGRRTIDEIADEFSGVVLNGITTGH
jgi:AcrR family transcriptional regulator